VLVARLVMSVDTLESHSLATRLKSLALAMLLLLELARGHNVVTSTSISIAQGGTYSCKGITCWHSTVRSKIFILGRDEHNNHFKRLTLLKNGIFWDVTPCGSSKNRVSEVRSASIIRVTRIFLRSVRRLLVTASVVPSSLKVPPKRLLLQEPHGVTSQKTPSFTVTAVKTSNLTYSIKVYEFVTMAY
jgi:hypothetical protein